MFTIVKVLQCLPTGEELRSHTVTHSCLHVDINAPRNITATCAANVFSNYAIATIRDVSG